MGTIIPLTPIAERSCGSCSECCLLMGVPSVNKDRHTWCSFVTPGGGCDVYANRPRECSSWRCGWLSGQFPLLDHAPDLRPDQVHGLFTIAGDGVNWLLLEHADFPGMARTLLAPQIQAFLAVDPTHYIEIVCGEYQTIIGNKATYYQHVLRSQVKRYVERMFLTGEPLDAAEGMAVMSAVLTG